MVVLEFSANTTGARDATATVATATATVATATATVDTAGATSVPQSWWDSESIVIASTELRASYG